MLFRVRKALVWDGVTYKSGECVEIEEGNPRIRPMLEQSHHIEYANRDTDATVSIPKTPVVTFQHT